MALAVPWSKLFRKLNKGVSRKSREVECKLGIYELMGENPPIILTTIRRLKNRWENSMILFMTPETALGFALFSNE